jgi:hypothetical protein
MDKYARQIDSAAAWEQKDDWRQVPCTVLSTGVACTEKDTGGTCEGYVPGKLHSTQPPYVFATEDIASCPGVYWCAKEGEQCFCDGDITYASRIFNGAAKNPYDVDKAHDPAFTITSNGSGILCDLQPTGPFPSDPTPGWTKHCWCTPSVIRNLSRRGDATFDKQDCALRSNTDFENGEQSDLPQAARRLASSPRRRRTFSYTPWALVEVEVEGVGRPSPSPPAKQLVCAYEFGNSLASYEDYQSDGAYSEDVWTVEDLTKEWSDSESRQCYIRVAGEAAQAGRACAAAMSKPGSLWVKRQGDLSDWKWWFWMSIAVLVIGLSIRAFPICAQHARRLGDDGCTSEASEESSDDDDEKPIFKH